MPSFMNKKFKNKQFFKIHNYKKTPLLSGVYYFFCETKFSQNCISDLSGYQQFILITIAV